MISIAKVLTLCIVTPILCAICVSLGFTGGFVTSPIIIILMVAVFAPNSIRVTENPEPKPEQKPRWRPPKKQQQKQEQPLISARELRMRARAFRDLNYVAGDN